MAITCRPSDEALRGGGLAVVAFDDDVAAGRIGVAVEGLHAVGVRAVSAAICVEVRPVVDVAEGVVQDLDAVTEEPQTVGVVRCQIRSPS